MQTRIEPAPIIELDRVERNLQPGTTVLNLPVTLCCGAGRNEHWPFISSTLKAYPNEGGRLSNFRV
jgi:hypothetical protein